MLIHLVRHGHAGSRSDYDGPDELRPLTGRGHREAVAIAEQLAEASIDEVWSSSFVRCRQTLEPLAAQRGLPVAVEISLTEGGDGPSALDALLAAADRGTAVAACSHGDVIPLVIAAACRRGATLDGPPSPAKGARYVLEVVDGEVRHITHVDRPAT